MSSSNLPDAPDSIEELARQVVISAAPHPNLSPIPYSLQTMKNFVLHLVNFKNPRSYDWSSEPGLTPLQIETLREIERLFLESRAFYKLLHEIYRTWREHQVEPRPSAGSFFKAVTRKDQHSFDDSHPVFQVFWGSQEGNLTWSGEDVIPVMRELVNNLVGRQAAVPPIPAEVVVVEDGVENSVDPNGNVEDDEPDVESAEVLEVEGDAQEMRASDADSDGAGNKENQPVVKPVEQADNVKPMSETLVGTRLSIPADLTKEVRSEVATEVIEPTGELNHENTYDDSFNQNSSNFVSLIARETFTSSIPADYSPLKSIEEEHSYAKSISQRCTENAVSADILPALVTDSINMIVDHEEEVATSTFEPSARSISKHRARKRASKRKLKLYTLPKKAMAAKVDPKVTNKDGVYPHGSAKTPVSVGLADQDGSEGAAPIDVPAENSIAGSTSVGSAGPQEIFDSDVEASQGWKNDEVAAETISVFVSNLIHLVVRDEEEVRRYQEVQADKEPIQPAEVPVDHQSFDDMDFDEPENHTAEFPSSVVREVQKVQADELAIQPAEALADHQIFDHMEFDMPESYAVALVPSSVELAPIRRRPALPQAPRQTGQFFVIKNVWEMWNEKRRLLKSFVNQPPIQQGTAEFEELLEYAQQVFDNSGVLKECALLSIMPFLRQHICDPFEELEGDFPRTKIIIAPTPREMFLTFRKNDGKSRRSSKKLYTQWKKNLDEKYLLWVRLKKIVDEFIFLQVQSRVITGEPGRRTSVKRNPEKVVVIDLEKDQDVNEPPPKRQCFWMS